MVVDARWSTRQLWLYSTTLVFFLITTLVVFNVFPLISKETRTSHICSSVYRASALSSDNDMPTVYVITPTNSKKLTQLADLTRMHNTLALVPKLFWVLVEDSPNRTTKLTKFLKNSLVPHVHLNIPTPTEYVMTSNSRTLKPRGVQQRNRGIEWVLKHHDDINKRGVVYFADDDNTYDIRLFEEMRYTKKVSVWPVALVGGVMYEGPICENGKVVKWFTGYAPKREFAIDMAGFAINLQLLLDHPSNVFSYFQPGYLESHFLGSLVRKDEAECKADNGRKIYVWHTHTSSPTLTSAEKELKKFNLTYDPSILDLI